MIRTGTAVWNGSGKDGNGTVSTKTTVLNNAQYSYKSRFESGIGTNPEELIAAAHAGCFAMKLAFVLGAAGATPETLNTTCEISFENGVIAKSHLIVEAKVPGITNEQLQAAVKEAETNCPVSKVLNLQISSEAKLV